MNTKLRRGFTLIEILIVVVIIGLLAALVVPNITTTAEDAARSSAHSQLSAVRSQIELYKLRYAGAVPPPTGSDGTDQLWVAMTTPVNGVPFLMKQPMLPIGYSWNWNGNKLTVGYEGRDRVAMADAPTW
ncbi:MAG: Type secretion system protein precursor [Planctomycetota bacterium]|jgi:general secretion pathway protein G